MHACAPSCGREIPLVHIALFSGKNEQWLQVEGDPEYPWQRLQVSARLIHSLGWPVLLLLYHMARWLYIASRWDMMLDGAVHSWSTRQVAMALEGRRYLARCLREDLGPCRLGKVLDLEVGSQVYRPDVSTDGCCVL
nr:uncharacterized protein LOC127323340 isoform X2 [Lolium perenne]